MSIKRKLLGLNIVGTSKVRKNFKYCKSNQS